jgi:hypothetical protein
MAIYDERQRAAELEAEAKQGARTAAPADVPAWKDVRRDAASVRRDIPENVRSLRNDPEQTVPQAFQSGTGSSPNPLRPDTAQTDPTAGAGRLGEPSTPVNKLGEAPDPERSYANEDRARREDMWQQRQEEDQRAASQGDQDAQNRVDEYKSWRDIYDQMSPREQDRENRVQDQYFQRQSRIGAYADEHPGFHTDEYGDMSGDDVSPHDQREMQRLMRQRDQAAERIKQSHAPYVSPYAPRTQGRR